MDHIAIYPSESHIKGQSVKEWFWFHILPSFRKYFLQDVLTSGPAASICFSETELTCSLLAFPAVFLEVSPLWFGLCGQKIYRVSPQSHYFLVISLFLFLFPLFLLLLWVWVLSTDPPSTSTLSILHWCTVVDHEAFVEVFMPVLCFFFFIMLFIAFTKLSTRPLELG